MSAIIYEPELRYIVEIAYTVSYVTGGRFPGAWNFHAQYDDETVAKSVADHLAKENEYVRVIDRHATKENT